MAGKKQHHVWQMIQRGFGEKKGRDTHIWVYEDGLCPKQTVTRKYGVVRNYFTEGDDTLADDVLTEFESETANSILKIRDARQGEALPSELVAPIVSHLEMRSLFLREEMSRLAERLFQAINDIFSSEAKSARLMADYLQANPDKIGEHLDELELVGTDREIAKLIVLQKLPQLIADNAPAFSLMVRNAIGPMIEQLPDLVKRSHMKAIIGGFNEIERTAQHHEFSFEVQKTSEKLLLPDTGLAFLKKSGLTPISQKTDTITDVIIPLDEHTYLQGSKRRMVVRDEFTVNRILASCAFKSFIASTSTPQLSRLTKNIGKNSKLISERELSSILNYENLLQSILA